MRSNYFVLAGGYWSVSSEFGKQVDRQAGDLDKMADYVIRIDNLPEYFLKPPNGMIERTLYYCKRCQRKVSESEMENKFGCFGHPMERTIERTEGWDCDMFERYESPKKWLKDSYRIWVNKEKGLDKWREIHTYISGKLPTIVIPQPRIVGDRTGWKLEPEDIPVVELLEEKKEILKCELCEKEFESTKELRGHMMGAHNK